MSEDRLGRVDKPLSSLSDQVYRHLRHAIINGQIMAGTRLVELEIAAQMGTSQGPVRDALQRLERDGLVERHARSATFVTSIDRDEMYALFVIRSEIEAVAIRRAARTITGAQCDSLQVLVDAMRDAAQADDMATLVEHDLHFHQMICELSASKTLLYAWNPLYSQIQRFVAQTHKGYFETLMEIAETHQPIVDILRQRDAEEAARLIKQHIMLVWSRMN
jgi:DNA-binding GntR family transcriptional regulator